MALITIWIEDGRDGNVKIESDPPLTRLKLNAEEHRNMTPAVAFAMIGIAAMFKRAREMKEEDQRRIIH